VPAVLATQHVKDLSTKRRSADGKESSPLDAHRSTPRRITTDEKGLSAVPCPSRSPIPAQSGQGAAQNNIVAFLRERKQGAGQVIECNGDLSLIDSRRRDHVREQLFLTAITRIDPVMTGMAI
jgi:hypothetical protein